MIVWIPFELATVPATKGNTAVATLDENLENSTPVFDLPAPTLAKAELRMQCAIEYQEIFG